MWSAGRDACLTVETNDGQAWVQLRVGMGSPALGEFGSQPKGGQRAGGGPAQNRRRERRAVARQEDAAAEEAAATEKVKGAEEAAASEKVKEAEEAIAAGEAAENKRETQKATEKEDNGAKMSTIPQVDGIFDVKAEAEYEVIIDAHETCTSEDINEAIHTNFIGALDEIKDLDNDYLRNIVIEQQFKPLGERKSENNFKNLQVFRSELLSRKTMFLQTLLRNGMMEFLMI